MTVAVLAYGSTLEWSGDGGTTYTEVPEARAVPIPGITPDYKDVTNTQSVGGYLEFIPAMKDAGEISFTCNKTPELFSLVTQYATAGTLVKFRVTFTPQDSQTTGDSVEWDGYVSFGPQSTNVPDELTMEISVRISGAPVYTDGV